MAYNIISEIIGGKLILIEGEAYEVVKAYFNDLSKFYTAATESQREVHDAENRLGATFYLKLQNGSTYITVNDVNEAIAQEPIPEGFQRTALNETKAQTDNSESYFQKKLYRNESDKKLGGVCSGIAHWLNNDPNIIRILVAIIIFSSVGAGILFYIAAWIILPSKYLGRYQGKTFYRNPDNKILGGVCSGLAAYFHTSVAAIRFVVAMPLILSIIKGTRLFGWGHDLSDLFGVVSGSFSGLFITAYIVLWIVLPEAVTLEQKKSMYSDFKKNNPQLDETMNDMKDRLNAWGSEAKESFQNLGKQFQQNTEHVSKDIPHYGRRVGQGVGAVIGGIFKAIFFVLIGTVAITLFLVLLAVSFSGIAWSSVNNYLWTSDTQMYLAWGTIILFLVVPVIGLFTWLYRRLSKGRSLGNSQMGWSFGGLWAIGWILLMFFVADISKEFKVNATNTETQSFSVGKSSALTVKVSQPRLVTYFNLVSSSNGASEATGIYFDEDSLKVANVKLRYEKSDDSLFHIEIIKQALGKSTNDAKSRANNIVYNYIIKDSTLDLANGIAIAKNNAYRLQQVEVLVKIPIGRTVIIDESVQKKLYGYDLDRTRFTISNKNSLYYLMPNEIYKMGADGELINEGKQAEDAKPKTSTTDNNSYRWNDDENSQINDTVKSSRDGYRFDQKTDSTKLKLLQEIEQKQKELELLKMKVEKEQE